MFSSENVRLPKIPGRISAVLTLGICAAGGLYYFLHARNIKLSQSRISSEEISDKMEPKVCKVITKAGKGSGCFIDPERGILLTSFHLVGAVIPKRIQYSPVELGILFRSGYIDEAGDFTSQLMLLASVDEFKLHSRPADFTFQNGQVCTSTEMGDFLSSPGIREILFNKTQIALMDKEVRVYPDTDALEVHFDGEILIGKIYYPDGEDQERLKINYAYYDTLPIQITHFGDGTPFVSGKKFINTGEAITSLTNTKLRIGEVVYYAGYPLTQEDYSFSQGIISADSYRGAREMIVIEAPIAPGNSGGSAFIQRNGKLLFVGIITSEVAQVSEKMREIHKNLLKMRETVSIGPIGFLTTLRELTNVLLNNLSTGKGKAIVIRTFDQLYDLGDAWEARRDELFNLQEEFLVPKKHFEETRPHVKLYKYIIENKITRLTKDAMLYYLTQYADLQTRHAIVGTFQAKSLSGGDYIQLPAFSSSEDSNPRDLEDRHIKLLNSTLNAEMVAVNKAILRCLYAAVFAVSQGRLVDGALQHFSGLETPIQPGLMMTQKFYADHIGGLNRTATQSVADETRERRGDRIGTSTTITGTEVSTINDEIIKAQKFYALAIAAVNAQASAASRVCIALYFLSKTTHQLYIRTNRALESHVRDKFYYSVAKKGDQYFMHHFAKAGSAPGDDWKVLGLDLSAAAPFFTTVYYEDADPATATSYPLFCRPGPGI